MASGFSEWTCLPAAIAWSPTSTWASGTVRLTTISIAGIGEQRFDRHRRNAELGAARLRGRGVEVGDRPDVEDREGPRRLEIGGADIAAADDADADPVHDVPPHFPAPRKLRGNGRLPSSRFARRRQRCRGRQ